ncbi:flagellar M-ring protein FliF [bacterium]|nr:MAG: flagellar M-ring protein FliF [bacterium]
MDRLSTTWRDWAGRAQGIWAEQPRNTRFLVGTGAAVLIATIAVVAWLYSPAHRSYGVLFSNLSAQDAASVIQRLSDDKVPYELSEGGGTVRVPMDSLYAERVKLAGEGALKGNGSGWELFDKTNLGMTTFQEQVMKLRATEGELQRTIEGLTPVQSARVNIAQPEAQLYTAAQQPTTASIAVSTKPGMTLLSSEVSGITQLVAGAVPGLKAENVTIVDQDGNVLLPDKAAQGGSDDAINLTAEQLVAKQRYETSIQQSVQSMLDMTLGSHRAVARVSADMNFDANSTESKQYAPQGVVRSEQLSRERYAGTPAGRPAAGVPGTTSNIPTYQGVQQTATGNYSKSQTTRNYEVTESTVHHIDAPGKVTKLSVAVLVNVPPAAPSANAVPAAGSPTAYALTPADITKVRNAVSAAAGIDPARGDSVTVEGIAFNPSVFTQPTMFAPGAMPFGLPRWALAALVILLLLGGGATAFRMMRGRQFAPSLGADLPTFDATLAEELPPFEEHPMLEQAPGLAAPIRSAADLTREQMIEYVTTVAQENPDSVAKLVKLWLAE